jgi:energy-coupling factor transport system permease protein
MAELTDFGYIPKPTFMHGLDPRVKLAGLSALSAATLHAHSIGLALASALVMGVSFAVGFDIVRRLWRLKAYFLILLAILTARAVTTPGDSFVTWFGVHLTFAGISAGSLICWRLMVVILLGMLLTATTLATHIRLAVHWWLHWIPILPAQTISDLIGLLIRFIPLILIRAQLVTDAQLSRGIGCRNNPFYRMRIFSLALLRQIFLSADQLGLAMTARCYNPRRILPAWPIKPADAAVAVGFAVFCVGLLVL